MFERVTLARFRCAKSCNHSAKSDFGLRWPNMQIQLQVRSRGFCSAATVQQGLHARLNHNSKGFQRFTLRAPTSSRQAPGAAQNPPKCPLLKNPLRRPATPPITRQNPIFYWPHPPSSAFILHLPATAISGDYKHPEHSLFPKIPGVRPERPRGLAPCRSDTIRNA